MAAQSQPAPQIGKFKLTRPVRIVLLAIQLGIIVWIGYIAPPRKFWAMWLSAAGWIAFSNYWAAAAKNAAEAKTAESAKSRRVHELILNAGLFLLFLPIPGLRQGFLPASIAWAFLGLAVQASFVAFAVWARTYLGRNWSGRIEIKKEHELVRAGPYRVLRHPIYTAMLGMSLGTAIVDGHLHALLGLAFIVGAYWRKIRMEEANLRQAFGAEYDDYSRATWRLVPGLF